MSRRPLLLVLIVLAVAFFAWRTSRPRTVRTPGRAEEAAVVGDPAPEESPPEPGEPTRTPDARRLRITVLQAADDRPIEGAIVGRLGREAAESARTDARGIARLEVGETRLLWIGARKEGYLLATRVIAAGEDSATLHLATASTLRGIVVRARDGTPLPGALVQGHDFSHDRAVDLPRTTQRDGRFELAGVRAGSRWVLGAAAPGYWPLSVHGAGPSVQELRLVLGVGATLSGVVRTPGGAPAVGAELIVFRAGEKSLDNWPRATYFKYRGFVRAARTLTDSSGHYELRGLPSPGTFVVRARGRQNGAARVAPVEVEGDSVLDVDLHPTATVVVRVRDPEQRPSAGVPVTLMNLASSQGVVVPTNTDGEVRFGHVAPERHRLTIDPPLWRPDEVEFAVEAGRVHEHQFELESGLELVGRAIDATGLPAAGVGVSFRRRSTVTDPDGAFRIGGLDPAPGKLELNDGRDRYLVWLRRNVQPDGPPLLVVLEASPRVTGRLETVPRERQLVYWVEYDSGHAYESVDPARVALDGSFSVSGVPAGVAFTLRFEPEGGLSVRRTVGPLDPGAQFDVGVIPVRPGRTLRVLVTCKDDLPVADTRLSISDDEGDLDRTVWTDAHGRCEVPNLPDVPLFVTVWTRPNSGPTLPLPAWPARTEHTLRVRR